MQKIICSIGAVMFILFVTATVQAAPPVVSQWVPIGSGARALGMGNAFTSIADDATAAWWNPAGLAQLERPEVSLVVENRSVDASIVGGGRNYSSSDSETTLNFASVVVPLGGSSKGARKTLALSYGTFLDPSVDLTAPDGSYMKDNGKIDIASLTGAMELSSSLMLGVGYNKLMGSMKTESYEAGSGFPPDTKDSEMDGSFPSIGLLWKGKQFSAGAVYRTAFQMTLSETGQPSATIRYPYSGAIGAAYRPTENLTASLDVQYINTSVLTGNIQENFEDIVQKRLGLEYLIITKDSNIIPLRAGYYLANRGQLDHSTGSVDIKGFTVGTGIVFKDFQIDAAYNNETQDAFVQDLSGGGSDSIGTTKISRFLISMIYRF